MKYCKIPILLSLTLLMRSIGFSAENRPPNFIFILTDDISAEDLSIYGNQMIDTPNLERVAMRGLVFDNAYLTTSSCSPSRISLITGRYPHNTGAPEIHVELYKNGIQTPLVIAGPKVKPGRTNALVSAIDISATILELAGLSISETIQGVSFLQTLQDHETIIREVAFAERNWHRYSMHERMVRMGDWIYIRNNWPNKRNLSGESDPSQFPAAKELWNKYEKGELTPAQSLITLLPQPAEELYHLKYDPHNLKDVLYEPENKELVHQMRILLALWTNQTGDNIPNDPTPHKATIKGKLLEWERREMPGDATGAFHINHPGPIMMDRNLVQMN